MARDMAAATSRLSGLNARAIATKRHGQTADRAQSVPAQNPKLSWLSLTLYYCHIIAVMTGLVPAIHVFEFA
jgi:hypothetical protein